MVNSEDPGAMARYILVMIYAAKICFGLPHYEKDAYSNLLKILPPKTKFSDKYADIFHISDQNRL